MVFAQWVHILFIQMKFCYGLFEIALCSQKNVAAKRKSHVSTFRSAALCADMRGIFFDCVVELRVHALATDPLSPRYGRSVRTRACIREQNTGRSDDIDFTSSVFAQSVEARHSGRGESAKICPPRGPCEMDRRAWNAVLLVLRHRRKHSWFRCECGDRSQSPSPTYAALYFVRGVETEVGTPEHDDRGEHT